MEEWRKEGNREASVENIVDGIHSKKSDMIEREGNKKPRLHSTVN